MSEKQQALSALFQGYTGIARSIRRCLVKILAFYFKVVPLPKTFNPFPGKFPSTVVITESSSIIIEALLYSFARRIKLKDAVNLSESIDRQREQDRMYWISIHSLEGISRLANDGITNAFVTLNIFSGRGPFKSNPYYKLGFWDLFGILVLGRFLIIFLGKPLETTRFQNRGAQALSRSLRVDLYKNLKLVRGTPFQPIESQERLVIGGNDFEQELRQLSEATQTSFEVLKKQARAAFYDIAANPRRPMYRIVAFIARVLTSRLFTSVQTNGLETLREAVRDSTVVIVPMHRSHFDYILIGYKLYDSDLNPPLVAAGINLSFWPIGFIIRSVGGYFVKRNVRHDRLHALILKRYVSYLVKRGHLQEFFIEGGRSRSGRMRQPKVGLLNVFIDAYQKGIRRDISFVPVSITYENVIEDSSYGTENTGRTKEKESLLSLLKARRIFRKSYGDVMVNFGTPISLENFLRKRGDKNQNERARTPVNKIALEISRTIRDQTNPSLTSFAHTALLLAPRYGLPEKQLTSAIHRLGNIFRIAKQTNPIVGSPTPALEQFLSGRENLLPDIATGSTIQVKECLGEKTYFIPGDKRFTADFYKNASFHLFLPVSLLALSELMEGHVSMDSIASLHRIMEYDFILLCCDQFLKECGETLKFLKQENIVTTQENGSTFSSRDFGTFIPSLVYPFFQSLYWTLKNLHRFNKGKKQDYNSLYNKLQAEFRTAAYVGYVSSTEASSAPSISSALDTLCHLGVVTTNERSGKGKEIWLNENESITTGLIIKVNQVLTSYRNSALENFSF